MTSRYIFSSILLVILLFLVTAGCEKERIVESTEYIRDIEYIELPADTIYKVDSIFINNSDTINNFDTVYIHDTITYDNNIYDTGCSIRIRI